MPTDMVHKTVTAKRKRHVLKALATWPSPMAQSTPRAAAAEVTTKPTTATKATATTSPTTTTTTSGKKKLPLTSSFLLDLSSVHQFAKRARNCNNSI
ncbi:hypothetical protein ACLKA6_005429 [Drosophila palustris]